MHERSPAATLLFSRWRFPAGPIVSRLSDWHQRLEMGESEDKGAKRGSLDGIWEEMEM